MKRKIAWLLVATLGAASTFVASPGNAAEKKGPPACAAIDFRPVAPGLIDGEHEAGLYRSRFGRIEVKARVKGGDAETYFFEFNGKKPAPLASVPKSVEACLKDKKVGPADKPQAACKGSKLKVVIDGSAKDKVALLYAQQGREWRFCHAAAV
jgi:hypothetical protein